MLVSLLVTASGSGLWLAYTPNQHFADLLDHTLAERRLSKVPLLLFGDNERLQADLLELQVRDDTSFKVVVIGTSTMREALWSAGYFEKALETRTGKEVTAFNISSLGQPPVVSMALAEMSACNGADMVIVGVSPFRFSHTHIRDAMAYFGASSPVADAYHPGHYTRGRTYWRQGSRMAFRTDLLVSVGLAYLGKPISSPFKPSPHIFMDRDPRDKSDLVGDVDAAIGNYSAEDEQPIYNLFKAGLEAVRSCGATPVLIEMPLNPIAFERNGIEAVLADRKARLAAIAGDPAPLSLIGADELEISDFLDVNHLRGEEAMVQATDRMAELVAPLLENAEQ